MRDSRSVECTKSTRSVARAAPRTASISASPRESSYLQHTIAPGFNSWVFDYWNNAPVEKHAVGCGLEVGVQLEGDWYSHGHITGAKLFTKGHILGVTAGERYSHHHQKNEKPGRQVGFVIFGAMLEGFEDPNRELRFNELGAKDVRFLEFCRSFAIAIDHGLPPPKETAREVDAFVRRNFGLSSASPMITAKKELERHFEFDLSMPFVSEQAGIHHETFCRQFTKQYGISPASYRVLYRLNHATRLLWSRPDLTIEAIAEEAGFRNKSYFHRAYVRQYKMTPSAARERFMSAILTQKSAPQHRPQSPTLLPLARASRV